MRRPLFIMLISVILIAAVELVADACQFDTDCEVGSQCVKYQGQLDGYCVGGLRPGNQNDDRPHRDPLDITKKRGNTCQFDTDCGPGGQCVKGNGIYGTCL